MHKTVSELGRDHAHCIFSTGICGTLTAGQGKLDPMGYFEIDCPECAARAQERLNRQTDRVLSLVMGRLFQCT
jgi:hypothetical protein